MDKYHEYHNYFSSYSTILKSTSLKYLLFGQLIVLYRRNELRVAQYIKAILHIYDIWHNCHKLLNCSVKLFLWINLIE